MRVIQGGFEGHFFSLLTIHFQKGILPTSKMKFSHLCLLVGHKGVQIDQGAEDLVQSHSFGRYCNRLSLYFFKYIIHGGQTNIF